MKILYISFTLLVSHLAVGQVIDKGVALFKETGFKGEHFFITDDWSVAPNEYHAASIESIRVPPGWEVWVYEYESFKGDYMILTNSWTGTEDDAWRWKNDIHSIRIISKPGYVPSNARVNLYGKVAVFKETEFGGEHFFITDDWSVGRNEYHAASIESIRVPSGWEVWAYEYDDFEGDYVILTDNWAGTDDDAWRWKNDIHSIRVVRKTFEPQYYCPCQCAIGENQRTNSN